MCSSRRISSHRCCIRYCFKIILGILWVLFKYFFVFFISLGNLIFYSCCNDVEYIYIFQHTNQKLQICPKSYCETNYELPRAGIYLKFICWTLMNISEQDTVINKPQFLPPGFRLVGKIIPGNHNVVSWLEADWSGHIGHWWILFTFYSLTHKTLSAGNVQVT